MTDRKYNNSHNALNGTVRMLLTYVKRLAQAPSLTPDARKTVSGINIMLKYLDQETWRWRQEVDGSLTLMKHNNKREFYP